MKIGKILTHWALPLLTVLLVSYIVFTNPWAVQTAKLKGFDYQQSEQTYPR